MYSLLHTNPKRKRGVKTLMNASCLEVLAGLTSLSLRVGMHEPELAGRRIEHRHRHAHHCHVAENVDYPGGNQRVGRFVDLL